MGRSFLVFISLKYIYLLVYRTILAHLLWLHTSSCSFSLLDQKLIIFLIFELGFVSALFNQPVTFKKKKTWTINLTTNYYSIKEYFTNYRMKYYFILFPKRCETHLLHGVVLVPFPILELEKLRSQNYQFWNATEFLPPFKATKKSYMPCEPHLC